MWGVPVIDGDETVRGAQTDEVLPPDPLLAVLAGAMAAGSPSYDAVIAEHAPQMPGGASCRSCGFVYAGHPACPPVILAKAGYPVLADRVRMVPAADREYGALCELTVAVERMDARLNVIGARVATEMPVKKRRPARGLVRLLSFRR